MVNYCWCLKNDHLLDAMLRSHAPFLFAKLARTLYIYTHIHIRIHINIYIHTDIDIYIYYMYMYTHTCTLYVTVYIHHIYSTSP